MKKHAIVFFTCLLVSIGCSLSAALPTQDGYRNTLGANLAGMPYVFAPGPGVYFEHIFFRETYAEQRFLSFGGGVDLHGGWPEGRVSADGQYFNQRAETMVVRAYSVFGLHAKQHAFYLNPILAYYSELTILERSINGESQGEVFRGREHRIAPGLDLVYGLRFEQLEFRLGFGFLFVPKRNISVLGENGSETLVNLGGKYCLSCFKIILGAGISF